MASDKGRSPLYRRRLLGGTSSAAATGSNLSAANQEATVTPTAEWTPPPIPQPLPTPGGTPPTPVGAAAPEEPVPQEVLNPTTDLTQPPVVEPPRPLIQQHSSLASRQSLREKRRHRLLSKLRKLPLPYRLPPTSPSSLRRSRLAKAKRSPGQIMAARHRRSPVIPTGRRMRSGSGCRAVLSHLIPEY